jgi:hypothetical protein
MNTQRSRSKRKHCTHVSSNSAQSNLRPASSCLRGVVSSTTVPLRIALSRCMAASSNDSCTDFIIAWEGSNLCSPITYTCTPGSTMGQIVACTRAEQLAAAYLACEAHRFHRLPHKVCAVLKVIFVKHVLMSNPDKLVCCLCDDAMCLFNASALDQSKSDENFALIDLVFVLISAMHTTIRTFSKRGKTEHLQELPHPRNKDSARSRCKGR